MMLTIDWSNPPAAAVPSGRAEMFETTWLHSVRRLWCRHTETVVTPKTVSMPAHVVCSSCGWREPVVASRPTGIRTWDSSRDEARYAVEKKRRTELEERRQLLIAETALSTSQPALAHRRVRAGNVFELKSVSGN